MRGRTRLAASSLILLALILLALIAQPVYAYSASASAAFMPALSWQDITNWWGNATQWWSSVTKWFYDMIGAIWDGIKKIGEFIVNGLVSVGRVIADGWRVFWSFFGNWGDPACYNSLTFAKLVFPEVNYATNKTLAQLYKEFTYNAETASKREMLVSVQNWKNDYRTVGSVTPSGFLGVISYAIYMLQQPAIWQIIWWILQNFILIHAVAIMALLVWGLYASLQKRDFEPLANTVQLIGAYFGMYIRLISWIISRAIDLAQAIAQWLDTIIPF